jgi:DNA-binding transcriptional ArsR family regulator
VNVDDKWRLGRGLRDSEIKHIAGRALRVAQVVHGGDQHFLPSDFPHPVDGSARAKDPQQNGDVRLIVRAAAILHALIEQPHGASLGELAKATGIPRSTVQRLVNALEAERMVRTNGRQPGVRLGVELCRMAAAVEGDVRDFLRPYAERLLDRSQESVDITYWDKDVPVVIETFASPQALRRFRMSALGSRFTAPRAERLICP